MVDCFFSTYISSLTGFYLLVVFNLLGFNPYGIITHRFLNLLGIGENRNEILKGVTLFVYLFEPDRFSLLKYFKNTNCNLANLDAGQKR